MDCEEDSTPLALLEAEPEGDSDWRAEAEAELEPDADSEGELDGDTELEDVAVDVGSAELLWLSDGGGDSEDVAEALMVRSALAELVAEAAGDSELDTEPDAEALALNPAVDELLADGL